MWTSTLTYQHPRSAPNLISSMTHEQYLDAISCPRIDPIHKGRNIMRPLNADPEDFGPTTTDDDDGYYTDSDAKAKQERRRHQSSALITKPTSSLSNYLIELTAHTLSSLPTSEIVQFYKHAKHALRGNKDYTFLRKSHPSYTFFLWRLKRNRKNKGWNLQKLHQQVGKEADANFGGIGHASRSVELVDRNKSIENERVSLTPQYAMEVEQGSSEFNIDTKDNPTDATASDFPNTRRSNRTGTRGKRKGQRG